MPGQFVGDPVEFAGFKRLPDGFCGVVEDDGIKNAVGADNDLRFACLGCEQRLVEGPLPFIPASLRMG